MSTRSAAILASRHYVPSFDRTTCNGPDDNVSFSLFATIKSNNFSNFYDSRLPGRMLIRPVVAVYLLSVYEGFVIVGPSLNVHPILSISSSPSRGSLSGNLISFHPPVIRARLVP